MRIGCIGLGDQGGPMAEMLSAGGYDIRLWARRPGALTGALASLPRAATPADLARQCDVLALCVTGAADITAVLHDAGALAALPDGATVLIHSTVSPAYCVELTARAPHLHIVDAAVSGSGIGARSRSLVVMAGGGVAAVDAMRPLFACYAGEVCNLGGSGAGMRAKLAHNLVIAANYGVLAAAEATSQMAGDDPVLLFDLLHKGTARSHALDVVRRVRGTPRAAHIAAILAKDVALAASEPSLCAPQAAPLFAAAAAGIDFLRRISG